MVTVQLDNLIKLASSEQGKGMEILKIELLHLLSLYDQFIIS